jgi:hypothetical protein
VHLALWHARSISPSQVAWDLLSDREAASKERGAVCHLPFPLPPFPESVDYLLTHVNEIAERTYAGLRALGRRGEGSPTHLCGSRSSWRPKRSRPQRSRVSSSTVGRLVMAFAKELK